MSCLSPLGYSAEPATPQQHLKVVIVPRPKPQPSFSPVGGRLAAKAARNGQGIPKRNSQPVRDAEKGLKELPKKSLIAWQSHAWHPWSWAEPWVCHRW